MEPDISLDRLVAPVRRGILSCLSLNRPGNMQPTD
jgi:hypothetical protein